MKTFFFVLALWMASLASVFAQTPPTIITQPQSYAVVAGSNLTVSVMVTGAPAPSLQWQFNGTNLPGDNLSTLTLNSMAVTQSGSYDVVVTNNFGSVTSSVARLAAVTINKTWTGGGDGQSWSDANNWSGGTVPAANDSVFIGGTNGTIMVSGGLTISNLICQRAITFNGSLNVSGAVDVGQSFYISIGNSISVNGISAMLIAEENTTVNAVNLYAGSGGLISFPRLTQLNGGNYINTTIEAGPGAVLDLSSVQTLTGPTGAGWLDLNADAGAVLNLSGVTNLNGGNINAPGQGVNVNASATNGVVNLSSLLNFYGFGNMNAANGGTILAPNLNYIYGVGLYVDGSSTLDLTGLTQISRPLP